jgi:hypothetical protein
MRRVVGVAVLVAVFTLPLTVGYVACALDEGWAMASLIFGSVIGGAGLLFALMLLAMWLIEGDA